MNSRSSVSKLAATFLFAFITVWSGSSFAETMRIVVLEVRGGGTELLVQKIGEIEELEDVAAFKDQAWFLKLVKKRGVKAKKLLSRKRDVKYVMKSGKIDYIVAVAPTDEGFEALFVDKSGEPVERHPVTIGEDGLDDEGAKMIAGRFATMLGFGEKEVVVDAFVDEDDEDDEEDDEFDDDDEFDEQQEEAPPIPDPKPTAQNFLWVELRPQLIKHDTTYAGTNGALLTRNSGFYPGAQLEAEIYVGAFVSDSEAAGAGLFLGALGGTDSVISGPEGDEQKAGLFHLELEGGLLYRADTPLASRSTTNLRARFRVTARHVQYNVDSDALPATNLTTLNLVGKVAYPLFFDNFALEGEVTFVPAGVFGKGGKIFGQSSLIYGFGTRLGAVYGLGDMFGIAGSYGFRLLRTQFKGIGDSAFEDTQAFDLVQGLQIGIVFQF